MPRTAKDAEARQKEILDTAQQLFYSKGYRQTSVQDIIDSVGIAKGTFYYYFRSKRDLLDAMIGRMLLQSMETLEPMVNDEKLNAIEKFNRFFADSAALKIENEEIVRTLVEVYYRDDNALMRERTIAESMRQISPMLSQIIQQGVDEGRFVTAYPESSAEIVLWVGQHMTESVTRLFLAADRDAAVLEMIVDKITAHEEAIGRILGAAPGSIKITDVEGFRRWFDE